MECHGSACTLGGSNPLLVRALSSILADCVLEIKKWKLQGSNL